MNNPTTSTNHRSGGIGRRSSLRNCFLRVRVSPSVQVNILIFTTQNNCVLVFEYLQSKK